MKIAKKYFGFALTFLCALTLTGCIRSVSCPADEIIEEEMEAKPVIYLYPEAETDVTVQLDYKVTLTCTYPLYQDKWEITALPDGLLTDADGQQHKNLYNLILSTEMLGNFIKGCPYFQWAPFSYDILLYTDINIIP